MRLPSSSSRPWGRSSGRTLVVVRYSVGVNRVAGVVDEVGDFEVEGRVGWEAQRKIKFWLHSLLRFCASCIQPSTPQTMNL